MGFSSLPQDLLEAILILLIPQHMYPASNLQAVLDQRRVCREPSLAPSPDPDLIGHGRLMSEPGMFDHVISRWICKLHKLRPVEDRSTDDDPWPVDSVLWYVSTVVWIENERPDMNKADVATSYLCELAESFSEFLSKTRTEGEMVPPMRSLIHRTCSAFVFNHGFRGMKSRLLKVKPASIQRADLLPLLAVDGDNKAISHLISSEEGIDINHRNPFTGSALYSAAASDNEETVKFLLSHGADVNQVGGRWHTPLGAAAALGRSTTVLSALLRAGADPNLQGGQDNLTAIMAAAHCMNDDAVEVLLSRPGINVEPIGFDDEALIHYLCKNGDAKNFSTLVTNFPDVDVRRHGEYGPPMEVLFGWNEGRFSEDHDEIVKLLLDRFTGVHEALDHGSRESSLWHGIQEIAAEAREEEEPVPAAVSRIIDWCVERGAELYA